MAFGIHREEALVAVYRALDELNAVRAPELQIEPVPTTSLYGPDGTLTSLELVNLVVALEQDLADNHDLIVTLADEKAMSLRNSPFLTVATLADYLVKVAAEPQHV